MDSVESSTQFTNRQILLNKLPAYQKVDLESISIQQRKKGFIKSSVFFVFLCVGFGVGYYFSIPFEILYSVSAVLLLFLAFGLFNVYKLYPQYGYAVRERDVVYQRGYIVKKTTVIPFNRIQHVSTARGVLDKLLGIASLKVFTAGGQGSDIAIPGLLPEDAQRLKEAIAQKVSLEDE